MPGLVDLCVQYFGTKDLYEVLGVSKAATDAEIRKAYRKLSLIVHPDRVEENQKGEATEKFKVLGKIHSILSDTQKKAVYDESGELDDDSDEVAGTDWRDYWRFIFKTITLEDIMNYEKQYKGSSEELTDLKKAYLAGKGDMDHIFETVPFVNVGEEPRIKSLISGLIEREEVPAYKAFTQETLRKKERRKRKWEKEAEEASKLLEERGLGQTDKDLEVMIQQRQRQRGVEMDNFFQHLADKYGKKSSSKKPASSKKTTSKKK